MGQSPFRVPVPPLDRPTRQPDTPSMKSLRSSTASSREPRNGAGRPKPTPVPLSGFLNLSAASQQTRVPRPYFMPQPFLIASFRAFPSQRSRAPLEAASCLAVVHRRATARHPQPYRLRFPRRPRREAQLPGSPEDYELPFHEPKPASRSPWATNDGATTPRQLHPLRSFDPSASPFTTTRANPSRRPMLSWIYAPSETFTNLGASDPSSSEDLDTRRHPEALARGPRDSSPWHQVRPSQRGKPRQVSLSQRPDRFRPDCTASRRQLLLP
jgi:hypothetical protein